MLYAGQYMLIPIVAAIALFVVFVFITILYNPIGVLQSKNRIKRRLKRIADENPNFTIEKAVNLPFDFKLVLKSSVYYVKLLLCDGEKDLYIDDINHIYFKSSVKKSIEEEVDEIKPFINVAVPIDANREVKKLCIIYPRARFIFHRINDLQTEYVYEDMEFFGIKFISGEDFLNLEELK